MRMSIPLILKQDVSPGRLIVIDASDDHDSVRIEVNQISERLGFENTVVVKSDAVNSARQRNIGLQFVRAPVVMFPDDDSMWHPGFASNVLKIYEADVRRQVGGVSGLGVADPPPELEQPLYRKSALGSVKAAIQPYRGLFEKHYFPKPLDLIGLATWTENIDVVDDVISRRVPHITGFRMSFRTDVIRQVGFDETLGYGAGYSYHEDFDASLAIERLGYALVSAEYAKVCHYTFPGKRAAGYSYGFCSIANSVYVSKKHIGQNTHIYRDLDRYLKYKVSLYASRFYSNHGREVFLGAYDAWRNRSKLLEADDADLSAAYKALCDQYIKK
jgi:glycosyltransferase involved in cell wall biosynthesis